MTEAQARESMGGAGAYLDHAATTPMRPEAAAAMAPWLGPNFGNPTGSHARARAARQVIDEARDEVAEALGSEPSEVIFTSGGTEADNLAVTGTMLAAEDIGPGAVVCSAVEHEAVLAPARAMGARTVAVRPDGILDLDALADALDPATRLVAVMLANNETGVVQSLDQVADVVAKHAPQASLHTDAVAAFAWLNLAEVARRADLITISGHKIGGPMGVGVLVARRGRPLAPILLGGGQEHARRSGTQNVAGIAGLAGAVAVMRAERVVAIERVSALRDRLADGLMASIDGCVETGDRLAKVATVCSLVIPDVASEALLVLLDRAGVCASAASSCASGAMTPSHVLAAMGYEASAARGSLRLSLGWSSTEAEIGHALAVIPPAVARLRRNVA